MRMRKPPVQAGQHLCLDEFRLWR